MKWTKFTDQLPPLNKKIIIQDDGYCSLNNRIKVGELLNEKKMRIFLPDLCMGNFIHPVSKEIKIKSNYLEKLSWIEYPEE